MLCAPLHPGAARALVPNLVPVLAFCLAAAWSLPATAAFLESGGQVVMEAENFTSRSAPVDLPDGSDGAPNDWFIVPDESPGSNSFANARDGSFIQVNDAIGVNGEGNFSDPTGNGPFADYVVRVTTTGIYQLNARWDSPSGSSNSFYAFLLDPSDNQVGDVETYSGNSDRDFATNPWDSATQLWTISTPGDYVVRIAPREEGVAVDALVLQLASLPDPVGDGPPESPTDTDDGECEVVDFSQFAQADPIQNLSLFGGSVNLTVTALRNVPAGAVDATAYDTEMFDRLPGGLPAPPNASHDDTQRFILCNSVENGGVGECDGIVAMIPAPNFFEDADTPGGGTITVSGFTGDWEIPSYAAVDSDNTGRDIVLLVGAGQLQVATSTGQGNGTVETVNSDPHTFTGEATFLFEGSGGIDDIELCPVAGPRCGDGNVDPGETCDDGNDIDDDECRNDCTFCGDGATDPTEECDDGNDINDDTCRNDCSLPLCGDGILDPGESCDDGNDIDDDECRNDCSFCGDGTVDLGEQCDDRNNDDGDGCDAFCMDEPLGGQGCTPGYWKQSHHFDSWAGFDPSDDYEAVFGVDASFDKTLLGALMQGGGKEKALGRHAVAALLSASNGDVSYFDTVAGVISRVQDAYATGDFNGVKDLLDEENNSGCPLN